jgi:hypothetical protein
MGAVFERWLVLTLFVGQTTTMRSRSSARCSLARSRPAPVGHHPRGYILNLAKTPAQRRFAPARPGSTKPETTPDLPPLVSFQRSIAFLFRSLVSPNE